MNMEKVLQDLKSSPHPLWQALYTSLEREWRLRSWKPKEASVLSVYVKGEGHVPQARVRWARQQVTTFLAEQREPSELWLALRREFDRWLQPVVNPTWLDHVQERIVSWRQTLQGYETEGGWPPPLQELLQQSLRHLEQWQTQVTEARQRPAQREADRRTIAKFDFQRTCRT